MKVLREWKNLKIQHASLRNDLVLGSLEECRHCCIKKPHSDDRRSKYKIESEIFYM